MMGKNHLIGGTALAVAGGAWLVRFKDPDFAPAQAGDAWLASAIGLWPGDTLSWSEHLLSDWAQAVLNWVWPVATGVPAVLYGLAAVLLFWLGSLLPDIDSKSSMLGRRFHVPGPHHGITHTDWFLITLFLLSVPGATRVLVFLWLGAALHLFLDGLSRAGRVRFYPFGKHKVISFSDGTPCVVRSDKHRGLYKVGNPSELVVLGVIVGLSACSVVSVFWLL